MTKTVPYRPLTAVPKVRCCTSVILYLYMNKVFTVLNIGNRYIYYIKPVWRDKYCRDRSHNTDLANDTVVELDFYCLRKD